MLPYFDRAYGFSHLHKYIWNIVFQCRWLISSALTCTYTFWLCIWFKSYAQVHMKHSMSMQMTYIICTNIYLQMVTEHMPKYIWNIVCQCSWLISSALTYTYTWCICRWLVYSTNETLYVYTDDLYHLY
jgi:hypothetical protein